MSKADCSKSELAVLDSGGLDNEYFSSPESSFSASAVASSILLYVFFSPFFPKPDKSRGPYGGEDLPVLLSLESML